MNFKPILFSTPMVQAILEGRKTMTRRIVKEPALTWLAPDVFNPEFVALRENGLCPYGYPGDVLWVRETWQETTFLHRSDENYGYVYKSSDNGKEWESNDEGWKWKPSIFMPKAACRIFLEVTDVKVERLQDISEADAIVEGIEVIDRKYKNYWGSADRMLVWSHPQQSFKTLWQSINGEESWNDSPWVWVVCFKRIDKPATFNQ